MLNAPDTHEVPTEVLDEAFRVLAPWSQSERIPRAWRERMARAADDLYAAGARSAGER